MQETDNLLHQYVQEGGFNFRVKGNKYDMYELLEACLTGMNLKEIQSYFNLPYTTFNNRISRLYQRIGVKDRYELMFDYIMFLEGKLDESNSV